MFQRVPHDIGEEVIKNVPGSWLGYISIVILAGIGAGILEETRKSVSLTHPILAKIVLGNPGIVIFSFAILAIFAFVGNSIQGFFERKRKAKKQRNFSPNS
jgi:hypothetical protein